MHPASLRFRLRSHSCPTAPTANLQATDALPPTPNAEVCDCFQQSACVLPFAS